MLPSRTTMGRIAINDDDLAASRAFAVISMPLRRVCDYCRVEFARRLKRTRLACGDERGGRILCAITEFSSGCAR